MKKAELAQAVQRATDVSDGDSRRVVAAVFDAIAAALGDGDTVDIRGFGGFRVVERGARVGRNPRTGEVVRIEPARVPRFRAGAVLRGRCVGG